MESDDGALKGTENAHIMWLLVYMIVVGTFFVQVLHVRELTHARPFSWWDAVNGGLGVLFCLFPLCMGIAFRTLLKGELSKDLLSTRTYKICDLWIPQLLFIAYIAMALVEH
jgi:amino acid transporter